MNKRFVLNDMVFEVLPTTRANVTAFKEAALDEERMKQDVWDYTLAMLPFAVKPVGENASFDKLDAETLDVNLAQEAIRSFLPDGTQMFRALASF